MSNIAVVVPTIRLKESVPAFMKAWQPLFDKHNVEFVLVVDGEKPKVVHTVNVPQEAGDVVVTKTKKELDPHNLVSNFCAGVRQLGFLYIAKHLPEVEYIITLDDDEIPLGDPIQDHITQLNRKVPISWISTATDYMRGFPYGIRQEAPVMMSHGVWEGSYDWDAPSQLLKGDTRVQFYKGVIPKGIYTPICGMNLAFRREALPYVYFAPVGQFKGAERWDDIYMGVMVIKKFAELNWAITTGYAKVLHERASNPFTSLAKEAVGILHGEEFYKDPENYKGDVWFNEFREKTKKWFDITYNI
ncbi:hypothetical protein M0R04_14055 [Candidatus Dojkabacteria bacterium]|jgi:reversibly glycosylated polypeptide/UDP-arabinopyranose mutase|nr:hypothetical protein [Candidatus Dojkabacteria bacterium]